MRFLLLKAGGVVLLFATIASAESPTVESLRGVADSWLRCFDQVFVAGYKTTVKNGVRREFAFSSSLTKHQGQYVSRLIDPSEDSRETVLPPSNTTDWQDLLGLLSKGFDLQQYDINDPMRPRGFFMPPSRSTDEYADVHYNISADQNQSLNIYFPFVASGRRMPTTSYVLRPLSDRVLDLPLTQWELQGVQTIGTRKCVVVRIKKESKPNWINRSVENRIYYRIGFDPSEAYFPIYFEESHELTMDNEIVSKAPAIYKILEFDSFVDFGSGVRFPQRIRETENHFFNEKPGFKDELQNITRGNRIEMPSPSSIDTTEWFVTSIKLLDRVGDIWIDIPDSRCLVIDSRSDDEYFTGMPREESDKILGIRMNAEVSNSGSRWLRRAALIGINFALLGVAIWFIVARSNRISGSSKLPRSSK